MAGDCRCCPQRLYLCGCRCCSRCCSWCWGCGGGGGSRGGRCSCRSSHIVSRRQCSRCFFCYSIVHAKRIHCVHVVEGDSILQCGQCSCRRHHRRKHCCQCCVGGFCTRFERVAAPAASRRNALRCLHSFRRGGFGTLSFPLFGCWRCCNRCQLFKSEIQPGCILFRQRVCISCARILCQGSASKEW